MHTPASPRRVAGVVTLGLLAATLVALPGAASANPAGTGLVINEAYGGGGNSGATWKNDFIELYNPTDAPMSLEGLSVQYRSASGSGTGFTNLSGSVPARSHFLLQQSAGSGGTQALPTPDGTGTLAMSGTAGSVALVNGTGTVAPTSANTIDLVGWGSSTTLREGAPAPGTTNATSTSRKATGVDTDDNSADFAPAAPTPTNSLGETEPPTVITPPARMSIADIQGDGAASPHEGSVAITEGVVTATYRTGGFNGFYIQTGGPDTTPGRSDGLFVYEPGFAATIEVGDSVEVEGTVKEFSGLTEIDAARVTELTTALPAVVPNTEIPGTTCALPGTDCPTGAALDALREEYEGEVFLPTAPMTVTDAYDFGVSSSSFFGEIGIAAGSTLPLIAPTEVVDAQDTAGIAARTAYNDAHRVVLDDGSSANYWNTSNTAGAQGQPLPYLTADHTVRVGAAVTFHEPIVLDYRFGWKLQPQRQVVGEPSGLMTFEQDRPAAPAKVGGDLQLATFNVLNYFTTFGGAVPGCTAYVDRHDVPIATRSCLGANGPRGAWDEPNFLRQQAKVVRAINTLDADVVSLEELENSRVVDGGNRDEALASLVGALNDAAGKRRWAYVASPAAVPASEDVIRTGYIYDPATVRPVGEGRIHDAAAFDNARDPLAQAFEPKAGGASQRFVVIANHFKSKGSGVDDGTGQGNANPDRVAQARSLAEFAAAFSATAGTDKVFLTGDFNAYTEEDPIQELEAAGFSPLTSTDDPDEETYSFSGMSGSLDHVLANAAAKAMVTGVDIWEINANESVYYQYSRYNYVGTDLYRPDVFASSDHNPALVGIRFDRTPPAATSSLSATLTPNRVVVDRTRARLEVSVTRGDGAVVRDGTVTVREGAETLGSASVTDGKAVVRLEAFTSVGGHQLTVSYSGGTSAAARTTVDVDVVKARARIRPGKVTRKRVKGARVTVKVRAEGMPARGRIKVKLKGNKKWVTFRLRDGKARVRLQKLTMGERRWFVGPRKRKVIVRYLGNAKTQKARRVIRLTVKPR